MHSSSAFERCITCRVVVVVRYHLVLVLRAVGRDGLQRGEQVALGAGLRARVQLTQLKEVVVLRQLLIGQVRHHKPLLQEATALKGWTHDVSPANLYLRAVRQTGGSVNSTRCQR